MKINNNNNNNNDDDNNDNDDNNLTQNSKFKFKNWKIKIQIPKF